MKFKTYAYDWIVWGFFLVTAGIVFWQTDTSLTKQGVATGGPLENAAIFPNAVAWIIVILSVWNTWRIFSGRITNPSPMIGTPTTRLALISTFIFLLYLLTLNILGYYLATPMMLVAYFWLFGAPRGLSILIACLLCLAIAAVFEGFLNVVLPLGFLKLTLFN